MLELLQAMNDNKDAVDAIIAILGVFGGLIGAAVACGKYFAEKKEKQIADWLQLFAEEKPVKRLSAVSGLTKSADKIFDEIFFISNQETNYYIKELLIEALKLSSKNKAEILIKYNTFFVRRLLETFQIICLLPEEEKANVKYYEQTLMNESEGNRVCEKELILEDKIKAELTNFVFLSSQVLPYGLKKKKKMVLDGVFILNTSMHSLGLRRKEIKNSILLNNIMRHMNIICSNFEKVDIVRCNLFDTMFTKTNLNNIQIRACNLEETKFAELRLEAVVFNNCEAKKASFSDTQLSIVISDSIFNGAQFNNVTFNSIQTTSLEELNKKCYCSLKGTNFLNCTFINAEINRSNVVGEFRRCTFNHISFKGSDLKGSIFINCKFEDFNFRGADLKGVKFIDCQFETQDGFLKAKNFNSSQLINAKIK